MSRLGIRLGVAFALVVAMALAAVTAISIRTIRNAHEIQLQNEAQEKLGAIVREFEWEAAKIAERLRPLSEVRDLTFRVQPRYIEELPAVADENETSPSEPYDDDDVVSGPVDPIGVQRLLREILPVTGLDSLEVTDRQGRVIARAHYPESFGGVRSDSLLESALSGTEVMALREVEFPDQARLSLSVAVPITSELSDTEYVVGVLIGGVRVDNIAERLGTLSGSVVTISAEGHEIHSTAPPSGGVATERAGLFRINSIHKPSEYWWSEKLPLASGRDVDGELTIWVPATEIIKTEQTLVGRITRAGGVAIVLSALLGLALGLGPTRRLRGLTKAAVRIGNGELDAPVKVHGRDEIGILGNTLERTAQSLKEERERLAASERVAAWRDAARRLAHELKNAITPISLSLQTARRAMEKGDSGKAVAREAVGAVGEEIQQLRGLVDEFSRFARLPAPRMEPYDLKKALGGAARVYGSSVSAPAEEPGSAVVEVEIDEDVPRVFADAELMSRVWSNLIGNAVEAAGPGGLVRIDAETTAETVRVRISDTGPGLPQERIEGEAVEGRSGKPGGWGIGLALVERILAEHNGRLVLENMPDGGARVTAELPREGASAGGSFRRKRREE